MKKKTYKIMLYKNDFYKAPTTKIPYILARL